MNLTKETIEKAVSWWAEKLVGNQPHSNGDNSYASIMTCLLADSRVKKISKKQIDIFKKSAGNEDRGRSENMAGSFCWMRLWAVRDAGTGCT